MRFYDQNGALKVTSNNYAAVQSLNDLTDVSASPATGDALVYNGTQWVQGVGGATPAGVVADFAGTAAPDGWFMCLGGSADTTVDADLFAVIGYTYGGAGSTFFLPDYSGVVLVGIDSGNAAFDTVGEAGGASAVALAEAHLPNHDHSIPAHNHGGATVGATAALTTATALSNGAHFHYPADFNGFVTGPINDTVPAGGTARVVGQAAATGGRTSTDGAHTHTVAISQNNHSHGINTQAATVTGGAGSGNAHTNLQPYVVTNKIIKR